jgi:ABC-type Zn uptake system ZnuABC Zn-binding protein ZnuA
VLLAACGGNDDDPGSAPAKPERPLVVATTTQLGDIVRQVAGDGAEVHQLLHANSDPHEYEPRPADIEATAGAQLVVASGDGLDHWMGEVVKEAGGDPVEVAIAPDHTPYKVAGEPEEGEEHASSEFDRTGGMTRATSSRRSASSATRSPRQRRAMPRPTGPTPAPT